MQKKLRSRLEPSLNSRRSQPPGSEWFKVFKADEYTKFDDQGLPTHNNKDKELSEVIRNKLKKEQVKQQQVYYKWRSENNAPEESK